MFAEVFAEVLGAKSPYNKMCNSSRSACNTQNIASESALC